MAAALVLRLIVFAVQCVVFSVLVGMLHFQNFGILLFYMNTRPAHIHG